MNIQHILFRLILTILLLVASSYELPLNETNTTNPTITTTFITTSQINITTSVTVPITTAQITSTQTSPTTTTSMANATVPITTATTSSSITTINSTTPTPTPTSISTLTSTKPISTTTKASRRKFDGFSFIGGMILAGGLCAIVFLVVSYLRRTDQLPYSNLR